MKDSGLLELLSSYGEINYTGGYKLNLMNHGDIDIHIVQKDFLKESVSELLDKLIKQNYWRGYYFGDYVKFVDTPGFPIGYYIGVNKYYKDNFWVVSLWFVKQLDEKQEKFMNYIQANMTTEKRYEILRLKSERQKPKEMSGFEIYRQVFNEYKY